MKKIIFLLSLAFCSSFCYSQYVYTIKADSVKLTNDSCNTELIIENFTRNVCGFLFNKGNGRTEFRKILVPLSTNKYLVGCDTLNLSGISSNITAKDGLLRSGDSLYLGNTISGSGTHNFAVNRYQYLNGKYYSIGGTINDPVTKPVARFYDNGDFTIKAQNNLTGNTANNGLRYDSKYGIFEVGTGNNFDTTLSPTCCGGSLKSAIIINGDVANTIKGHVYNSIMGGALVNVDTLALIADAVVFGESHHINAKLSASIFGGFGHIVTATLGTSLMSGLNNNITFPSNGIIMAGAFNTTADTANFSTINGILNTFGGVSQVVFGSKLINRSPFGITMGNKNVDFSTLAYTGQKGRASLQTISNLQNYPLFVIANSYGNESSDSVRSNAITTLFNGRTQINTTGFNTNLSQANVTPKAAFEVVSTNSGVLLPSLTIAQRNSIISGDLYNGLLLYNTDLNKFQYYKGTVWTSFGDSASGSGVTSVATGYGLSGGTITSTGTLLVDSATLSNYYLRRKDSTVYYPYATNPKSYLTSAVTSVATGYGLTGGTVTSTGTLLVDSATLSNYYLRRKDSTVYYPYASNPKGYLTSAVTAVQEDGSGLTSRPTVNFNYGVKATDNSGSSRTDVDVNLTTGETFISADVTMTTASTFYDGGSVSLTAGTWLVMSTGTIESTANTAMRITGKMWDGTTVYAASEGAVGTLGGSTKGYITMSMSSIITLAGTTTIKSSYTSTLANCVLKATPADNSTGTTNKASSIRAVRIK